MGAEHLGHGPVVAGQIDHEGLSELRGDSLIGQKIADIEQVAGMLAVQRRHDLAGVEIRVGDHPGLGIAEALFHRP